MHNIISQQKIKYSFLCIKDRKQSDTREAGMDWNMEIHKTAAVALLCPAQKSQTFIVGWRVLCNICVIHSWHSFFLLFMAQDALDKFQTLFNTEILEPAKWDHKHAFLSQELTLASYLIKFTRILMTDCMKK